MWEFVYDCISKFKYSRFLNNQFSYSYLDILRIVEVHGNRIRMVLPPGSKCAVLCDSGLNAAIAILTCWYADIIPIPMSRHYGCKHCSAILSLTEPDLCITDNVAGLPLELCYSIDIGVFMGDTSQLLSTVEREPILSDVAIIMCTSGTTGSPKGALITSLGLQQNVIAISDYFKISQDDSILIARPIYHCAVLTGEFLVALYCGTDIAFYDESYNPHRLIEYANQVKSTVLCGTPTLLNHISTLLKRSSYDVFINKLTISGECLSVAVANNIRLAFPTAEIYSVYGLTENSPRVSFLPCEYFDQWPDSVGIPLKKTEIRIIVDNFHFESSCKAGEHGQIWVKSPSLMKGYYRNKQLTKQVIVNGWLNTGDIGYMNEENFLFILSRSDDMIIKAGMNIYPREIESILNLLPPIRESLVYGVRSVRGEEITADIVLNESFAFLNKKDLLQFFMEYIPSYQIPTHINIVGNLPKNASGKIVRPSKERKHERERI